MPWSRRSAAAARPPSSSPSPASGPRPTPRRSAAASPSSPPPPSSPSPPRRTTSPWCWRPTPLVRATAIDDAQQRGRPAAIVGSGRGERGRILAVEPDWPAAALALAGVGLVGVEADGASGRQFKAPAGHEPALPGGVTHVLAVVGLTVLGKPLDSRAIHRPERVRALTDAQAGDPVTPT